MHEMVILSIRQLPSCIGISPVVLNMRQRVMMFGLDGAPWTLLSHWISKSKLPTFKRITQLGSKGILKSTIPCVTFPAVPSMLTGMNPGNLGVFSFIKPDGSSISMRDIRYQKIWNILDQQNRSSCILNVPLTFPPEKINGLMISGWIPSEKSNYTYPKDLRKLGFYNDDVDTKIFRLRYKKNNPIYRMKLIDLTIERTERRYNIFKKLNREKDYDFSLFWVSETDILQHCCWEYKESLLQFYIKLDNLLSDALSSFPDRNLFVVSDHGFESRPRQFFFANTWLQKQGYLKKSRGMGGALHYFFNFGEVFAYNYLSQRLIGKILAFWRSLKKHKADSNQECVMEKIDNFPGIDRKNSKAYLGTLFGIHVNNCSSYEAIREEIIEKLRKLRDGNGAKVMRNVWKKEEVFMGEYLKEIPDIIFRTSEKYMPFPALTKNLFGKVKRTQYWWQTGEHYRARDGILLACGPAIRKKNDPLSTRIENIAPTILYLIGCEIPKHVDGRVLTEICVLTRKPILKEHEQVTEEIRRLKREDEEKIKDRLRKLGYL